MESRIKQRVIKDETQMAEKHFKNVRQQGNANENYFVISSYPVRKIKNNMTNDSTCQQGLNERRTLIYCWGGGKGFNPYGNQSKVFSESWKLIYHKIQLYQS